MIVRIDPTAPVPPYEQLRAQVAASITSGQLAPGHRLPPIRQLAADLDLAAGTVARAYRELEAAGLVISAGRRGTRVVEELPTVDADAAADHLAAAASAYATALRGLGLGLDEAIRALEAEFGSHAS